MHIELPEKRYYAIGEVAKAFKVNTTKACTSVDTQDIPPDPANNR